MLRFTCDFVFWIQKPIYLELVVFNASTNPNQTKFLQNETNEPHVTCVYNADLVWLITNCLYKRLKLQTIIVDFCACLHNDLNYTQSCWIRKSILVSTQPKVIPERFLLLKHEKSFNTMHYSLVFLYQMNELINFYQRTTNCCIGEGLKTVNILRHSNFWRSNLY